jgi:hypothetical protein
VSHEELLQSYPSLHELDIQAALAYAAELAREGTADLRLEHTVLKLRIDENLPAECAALARNAGDEADTVANERLAGADDTVIASRSRSDDRVLLTLDLDFSNVRAYPQPNTGGRTRDRGAGSNSVPRGIAKRHAIYARRTPKAPRRVLLRAARYAA